VLEDLVVTSLHSLVMVRVVSVLHIHRVRIVLHIHRLRIVNEIDVPHSITHSMYSYYYLSCGTALSSNGLHGRGGSMYLTAGQGNGIDSVGGSIEIAAGGSASRGGDVNIQSGTGDDTSGKVVIGSAAANVMISSGSSSGTEYSGSGM
jgi:hypothetical protein